MERSEREKVVEEYRGFCLKQNPDYYAYENLTFHFSSCERYEVIRSIGRGKYSDVYEGVDTKTDGPVVIKMLKPVRKVKIAREIRILEILRGGPNIITLLDICFDTVSGTPSLIFERLSVLSLKQVMLTLSLYEMKVYMFQVFKALDYCHSRGIMHRDVKPMNIIVCPETKTLKLIDWGLSEFFIDGKDYNTRVSSRPYKSPELLVNYTYYDFSLDIWSAGTMLAAIMFRKEHFFLGKDNNDQLVKIASVLGMRDLLQYTRKYGIEIKGSELEGCKKKERKDFASFVHEKSRELCTREAMDLLSKMLIYDHNERITAREALRHPLFDDIRDTWASARQ